MCWNDTFVENNLTYLRQLLFRKIKNLHPFLSKDFRGSLLLLLLLSLYLNDRVFFFPVRAAFAFSRAYFKTSEALNESIYRAGD